MTEVLFDREAEAALIGSVFQKNGTALSTVQGLAAVGLRAHHFYFPLHSNVYTAMLSLADHATGVDPVTVVAELERLGRVPEDPREIHSLALLGDRSGDVAAYATRVREVAEWRAASAAADEIRAAIAERDREAMLRAVAALEAGATERRRETYSPSELANLLFDFLSTGEGTPDWVVPLPFEQLNRAMAGGIWPGEVMLLGGQTSAGKALACSTPIPTPTGWTTMGELKTGDYVFGMDGNPTRVTLAHPIDLGRPCSEVEFDDGTTITADDEHLWLAGGWRARRGKVEGDGGTMVRIRRVVWEESTVETRELGIMQHNRPRAIRAALPLVLPRADLPIPPYVLGVWLGDGTHRSGTITCGYKDVEEMTELLRAEGESVTRIDRAAGAAIQIGRPFPSHCEWGHGPENYCWHANTPTHRGHCLSCRRIGGRDGKRWNVVLIRRLASLGISWPNPKRIPAVYLSASIEQRLALLQGLVDSDGYVGKRGDVEFTSIHRGLAEDVLDLALSLGILARLREKTLRPGKRGTDRCYRVVFKTDLPIARLSRKRERLPKILGPKLGRRHVWSVTSVPSVPVRCITVEAEDGMFLAGRSLVPTHNSILADMALDLAADRGFRVHCYMTEMTALSRGLRYLTRRTGVPFPKLRARDLSDEQRRNVLDELKRVNWGLSIVSNWSIEEVVADALRARHQLVVIDLLHGFSYADERGLDGLVKEACRLARVSTTIDGFSGTAVIAGVHLQHGAPERPTHDHIKGGGSPKQDADFAMFVRLLKLKDGDDPRRPKGEVYVTKGRSGDKASVPVILNGGRFRFEVPADPSLAEQAPAETATSMPF